MLSLERLSYRDAMVLMDGAEAKAREIGVPMCIAVCDEAGHLIAFQRMDGAKILSVALSQDKAMTSAISRRPTHEYNARCIPGNLVFGIHTSLAGHFSIVGGGLAVDIGDGGVVGGIGVSGGAPEQDIACAEAALAVFLSE